MPLYDFECEKCNHFYEEFHIIAEMDKPLNKPCPSCKKKGGIIRIVGSGRIVDSARLESTKGRLRPTKEFTEVMTRIKKNHPASRFEVR
jgi:putative FmdB family regulatory protein